MAYGAPIVSGTAGFRISAWFESQGGFIDKEDPYTGEILRRNTNSTHSYVIRPAFTWTPAEGLTITPALFMQHFHSDNLNSYWITDLPYFERGAHVSGAIDEPSNDDLNVRSLAIKYSGNVFVPGLSPSWHDYLNDSTYTRAIQQEFRLSSQDPSTRLAWKPASVPAGGTVESHRDSLSRRQPCAGCRCNADGARRNDRGILELQDFR